MPTCAICQKSFPNRLKIDGKFRVLKSRKRCLECSPFGSHNTSSIARHGKELREYSTEKKCKRCLKKFVRKGSYCAACQTTVRRERIRRKLAEYKGGKCERCGYDKCTRALAFHHRDPKEKLFNISGNECRSWEIVKREVDKCDMLCHNCHAEVEEIEWLSNFLYNTIQRTK